jgi:hypothetical protein
MVIRVSGTKLFVALALLVHAPIATAQSAEPTVRVDFSDSTLAGLAPTKRVAISSVIVSFQASVGAKKEAGSGMFADKSESTSTLGLVDMDSEMQDAIAAEAYRSLKADLTAAGFEIVPEAEVKADASYRELIGKAGFVNHSKSANALGDAILVSPSGLTPYMPYTMEGSAFQSGVKSYLGWGAGWGKPATPGGYSLMTAATYWKLPGLEVQMAKSLNAHVVKAFYIVTLGQTSVKSSASSIGSRESGEGSTVVVAQSGLLPDQTRISFRSPTGNAKWQKVAFNRPAPAKDGDVVVHLAEPMLGSKSLFAVDTSGRQRGMLLYGVGDFKFTSTATITNPAAYRAEMDTMIATATRSMVATLRR